MKNREDAPSRKNGGGVTSCTMQGERRERYIQNERRRIARAMLRVEASVSDRRTILVNLLFFVCLPAVSLYLLYFWWRHSGILAVGVLFFTFLLASLYLSGVCVAFIVMTYPTRARLRRKRIALRYWRREAERLEVLIRMQEMTSAHSGTVPEKQEKRNNGDAYL